MLLKTFKGRILAVSLGMTIVSVLIFGYGLSGIYHQHMHKCLNRSLSFLTNMLSIEFDTKEYSKTMQTQMYQHPQLLNVLQGGLIYDIKIEMLSYKPLSNKERIYQFKKLGNEGYFTVSSSTEKINEELVSMVSDRWVFFIFGFVFTSLLIYFLVRLLFIPFNKLVNHCLTCEDPDKKPEGVTGGSEIITLRDAIASLQQRISRLQKAQHESMKALTHELKTPLAQLRLRIDLANQKGKWSEESIEEAKKEIDEISHKITKILHSRKVSQKVEKTHLKKSVLYLIDELQPLWEHRGLTFEIDMSQDKVLNLPVEAYQRVLRILIENTINHSLKGATIHIHCRQAVLTITNPISREKNKIIDSTGKGLEIVKTLCNYYKWEFDAHSIDSKYQIVLRL
ncbi:hypothetical protein M947_05480 [Sulfurimonas hongkongensis]|uniref:histidine kinase n=1 Tax=Sulfurimonas hongkongensis TaxID=1172190 RepID=T0KQU8_9BACT|nr:HAMP domain-containing sensor histidine kinase [Sulfurimonas hongkongensis]EQB39444.1 hypothetical protein M947_05480 [Sulfurimonas hongkongensis]